MPGKETKRHVKVETDLAKTTGSDTRHERMNARPDAEDMTEAEEVWKDAETTPSSDDETGVGKGGAGRVADAGDVGAGQASPYGTESQADALARQTDRTDEPRDVEKPKGR